MRPGLPVRSEGQGAKSPPPRLPIGPPGSRHGVASVPTGESGPSGPDQPRDGHRPPLQFGRIRDRRGIWRMPGEPALEAKTQIRGPLDPSALQPACSSSERVRLPKQPALPRPHVDPHCGITAVDPPASVRPFQAFSRPAISAPRGPRQSARQSRHPEEDAKEASYEEP